MKTVTIDDEVYTKASILAKQFGYTSDYIGQLCRANKVDAELVGRSWYVNERSLNRHKEGRYKALRGNEIISKIKVGFGDKLDNSKVSVVSVRPTLSKLTRRSIPNTADFHWAQRTGVMPLATYEHDDYELVPESRVVRAEIVPEKVEVQLSESIRVPINTGLKTPYKSTISEAGQNFTDDSGQDENTSVVETVETMSVSSPRMNEEIDAIRHKHKTRTKGKVETSELSHFTPETVRMSELPTTHGSIIPLSFALALVVALLIITLDTQIVTNGSEVNSRLIFTSASLHQIFSIFGFLR